ncbi:hypothetical protein BDAP_001781 [Binucleata daphniae]
MSLVLIQFHNPPHEPSPPLQVPISIPLNHLLSLSTTENNFSLYVLSTQITTTLEEALLHTNLTKENTIPITLVCNATSVPALYNSSTFSGHTQAILCVKIQKDKVYSASGDQTIRLWDLKCRGQEKIFKHSCHWINCIEVKNEVLLSGSMDGKICVYINNEFVRSIEAHKKGTSVLRISNNTTLDKTNFVAGGRDGKVILYDLHGKSYLSYTHIGPVYDIIYENDMIISCENDAKIKIYKNNLFVKELKNHTKRINSIKLRNNILVSGGDDQKVVFYNLTSKDCVVYKEVYHKNIVSCVDISENNLYVASCSFDKTVRIWDIHTGNCLFTYFHIANVYKVIFRNNLVISCGKDRMIKTFCMKKKKVVSDFVCGDEVFDIDYRDNVLVAGCRDSKIYFFN